MPKRPRAEEQHIAVFGASGSGKTVLVSSFYGVADEQSRQPDHISRVVADDTGQGNRLRQNFLGMKNDAVAPQATRFASASYRFTLQAKGGAPHGAGRTTTADSLRFVWHDYPGEWFEEEPESAREKERRLQTFRSLLRSDVAVILIDGQKLADHEGAEAPYLKSVFWGMRDALLGLREGLLADGPLSDFPRIWVLALSKADLHPDLDARSFQELVIQRAAGEVEELAKELRTLVDAPEALSLGEDFMVLSSAKFSAEEIDVSQRVGLNLLLPVAWMLPIERLVQWRQRFEVPQKVANRFAENAELFAALIADNAWVRGLLRRIPRVGPLAGRVGPTAIATLVRFGGNALGEFNAKAKREGDFLAALVSQFKIDLDAGVERGVLVKDPR